MVNANSKRFHATVSDKNFIVHWSVAKRPGEWRYRNMDSILNRRLMLMIDKKPSRTLEVMQADPVSDRTIHRLLSEEGYCNTFVGN